MQQLKQMRDWRHDTDELPPVRLEPTPARRRRLAERRPRASSGRRRTRHRSGTLIAGLALLGLVVVGSGLTALGVGPAVGDLAASFGHVVRGTDGSDLPSGSSSATPAPTDQQSQASPSDQPTPGVQPGQDTQLGQGAQDGQDSPGDPGAAQGPGAPPPPAP